jgi:hypothetical protein
MELRAVRPESGTASPFSPGLAAPSRHFQIMCFFTSIIDANLFTDLARACMGFKIGASVELVRVRASTYGAHNRAAGPVLLLGP